ncbi:hypothetical protein CVT24_011814, partial [Panaeolus cyanescens]
MDLLPAAPSYKDVKKMEEFCRTFILGGFQIRGPDDLEEAMLQLNILASIRTVLQGYNLKLAEMSATRLRELSCPQSIRYFIFHPWLGKVALALRSGLRDARKTGKPYAQILDGKLFQECRANIRKKDISENDVVDGSTVSGESEKEKDKPEQADIAGYDHPGSDNGTLDVETLGEDGRSEQSTNKRSRDGQRMSFQ